MEKDYVNLQIIIDDLRKQIRKEQFEKAQLQVKIDNLEKQLLQRTNDKIKDFIDHVSRL